MHERWGSGLTITFDAGRSCQPGRGRGGDHFRSPGRLPGDHVRDVTIEGYGIDELTVDGAGTGRVFAVSSAVAAKATISAA